VIAQREHLFGVWYGPANALAAGVVDVADRMSGPRHDELHQAAVNVFLHERDGIRLTAGRTLSLDPWYRQLSVRRLMTMLERVLLEQMQWMTFEPHTPALRADVRHLVGVFLRHLYRVGAFAGATEEEAFFVRCDETLNPPAGVDLGRLIAEVGIAPAEPLEFLVLRIDRAADGTLRVEAGRG
jgi:phage tail sheath protein FI